MLEIACRLDDSKLDLQLILLCGRNEALATELRRTVGRLRRLVVGFTDDVPYYMSLSDFFIGKPGPGSISEALMMKLPVIVERNSSTMPQERYNTDWIVEKGVGMVVPSFRGIATAVEALLAPHAFSRYRANAAALKNRAVFEIAEILSEIVGSDITTQSGGRGVCPPLDRVELSKT
jgi:UDP-N-acetylglucosamine:LPS N-acetylglucosamine transferase